MDTDHTYKPCFRQTAAFLALDHCTEFSCCEIFQASNMETFFETQSKHSIPLHECCWVNVNMGVI